MAEDDHDVRDESVTLTLEGRDSPPSPPVKAIFSLEPIHEQSIQVLELFQDNGIAVGMGVMAAALTLARLMSPKQPLEPEQEAAVIQALVDFTGAYWAGGGIN